MICRTVAGVMHWIQSRITMVIAAFQQRLDMPHIKPYDPNQCYECVSHSETEWKSFCEDHFEWYFMKPISTLNGLIQDVPA